MRTTILKYIEKNSRVDLGELAVLLGTDEVTVANEIAQMEKEKIICGYHTLIDWDKVGMEKVTALIEVKVTPQRNSGGYDLLVTLDGKTLKEVSQFVSEKLSPVEAVISTATHFILKKYKDHGTILVKKAESERMLVTP